MLPFLVKRFVKQLVQHHWRASLSYQGQNWTLDLHMEYGGSHVAERTSKSSSYQGLNRTLDLHMEYGGSHVG